MSLVRLVSRTCDARERCSGQTDIWLAVSQIGFLWQGWEMASYQPGLVEVRVRELEGR